MFNFALDKSAQFGGQLSNESIPSQGFERIEWCNDYVLKGDFRGHGRQSETPIEGIVLTLRRRRELSRNDLAALSRGL